MPSINRRLTENLREYYTTGMGGMSRLIFTEAWHLHTKRLYGLEPAAWNLLWAIEMRCKKPECVDTPWTEEKA